MATGHYLVKDEEYWDRHAERQTDCWLSQLGAQNADSIPGSSFAYSVFVFCSFSKFSSDNVVLQCNAGLYCLSFDVINNIN